jgi:hypothetical protein
MKRLFSGRKNSIKRCGSTARSRSIRLQVESLERRDLLSGLPTTRLYDSVDQYQDAIPVYQAPGFPGDPKVTGKDYYIQVGREVMEVTSGTPSVANVDPESPAIDLSVKRNLNGVALPDVIGVGTTVTLSSYSPTSPDWYSRNLPDPVIANMIRHDFDDHKSVTYNDIMAVFSAVETESYDSRLHPR